jgi:transcriptional regulator with XRE-family HTH domain
MNQTQIAQELGISKSYLSMILKWDRRLTPELAEKLQQVPGVHKVVNSQALGLLPKQDVEGSNPFTRSIY